MSSSQRDKSPSPFDLGGSEVVGVDTQQQNTTMSEEPEMLGK